jgi:uncharacterized membrane protein YhaH (DUF805 family)
MDWKFLFLSGEGRIGQRDFWLSALVLIGVTILGALIPFLLPLVGLLLLWPWICVFTKRLHDFGKSGWLQVVPLGVGMVLSIVGSMLTGFGMLAGGNSGAALGASLMIAGGVSFLAAIINIGFLLWVGLSKGDAGPNRFGPPQTVSAFQSPAAGSATAPTTATATTVAPAPAETTATNVQPNPPSDHV